jgi:hypothetical protein
MMPDSTFPGPGVESTARARAGFCTGGDVNQRDVEVIDPEGNRIRFGEAIERIESPKS